MTGGLTWYQWLAAAAALISVLGFLWVRILRPLIRGVRRLGDFIEQLSAILEHWPEVQAQVIAHAGELTTLAFQLGELAANQKGIRRDVNELWRRFRREQGETMPVARKDPPT